MSHTLIRSYFYLFIYFYTLFIGIFIRYVFIIYFHTLCIYYLSILYVLKLCCRFVISLGGQGDQRLEVGHMRRGDGLVLALLVLYLFALK
jgi:hypothetical protein